MVDIRIPCWVHRENGVTVPLLANVRVKIDGSLALHQFRTLDEKLLELTPGEEIQISLDTLQKALELSQ